MGSGGKCISDDKDDQEESPGTIRPPDLRSNRFGSWINSIANSAYFGRKGKDNSEPGRGSYASCLCRFRCMKGQTVGRLRFNAYRSQTVFCGTNKSGYLGQISLSCSACNGCTELADRLTVDQMQNTEREQKVKMTAYGESEMSFSKCLIQRQVVQARFGKQSQKLELRGGRVRCSPETRGRHL